jgi:DNA polymerase-3 subunit delta
MHPLQVLAVLHSHYRRLLRVDDPSITGEKDAHAALGGKGSPYGSKKAWQQATSLGTDGLRAAYDLLARADLDIKGESGADPQTVIELLVARLTGLSRSRPGARRR